MSPYNGPRAPCPPGPVMKLQSRCGAEEFVDALRFLGTCASPRRRGTCPPSSTRSRRASGPPAAPNPRSRGPRPRIRGSTVRRPVDPPSAAIRPSSSGNTRSRRPSRESPGRPGTPSPCRLRSSRTRRRERRPRRLGSRGSRCLASRPTRSSATRVRPPASSGCCRDRARQLVCRPSKPRGRGRSAAGARPVRWDPSASATKPARARLPPRSYSSVFPPGECPGESTTAGKGPARTVWHVHVGRDVQAGQAVVHHALDGEPVSLEPTCGLRREVATFCRQASDEAQHRGSHVGLSLLHVGASLQPGDGLLARGELLVCDDVEVANQRVTRRVGRVLCRRQRAGQDQRRGTREAAKRGGLHSAKCKTGVRTDERPVRGELERAFRCDSVAYSLQPTVGGDWNCVTR